MKWQIPKESSFILYLASWLIKTHIVRLAAWLSVSAEQKAIRVSIMQWPKRTSKSPKHLIKTLSIDIWRPLSIKFVRNSPVAYKCKMALLSCSWTCSACARVQEKSRPCTLGSSLIRCKLRSGALTAVNISFFELFKDFILISPAHRDFESWEGPHIQAYKTPRALLRTLLITHPLNTLRTYPPSSFRITCKNYLATTWELMMTDKFEGRTNLDDSPAFSLHSQLQWVWFIITFPDTTIPAVLLYPEMSMPSNETWDTTMALLLPHRLEESLSLSEA